MSHLITRQHDSTTMDELAGQTCEAFVGVRDEQSGKYGCFYLKLSGVLHRFYLDAGLLFWRSHQDYDLENDLGEEGYVHDLGSELNVNGANLKRLAMEDGRLEIEFANGVRTAFENNVRVWGATRY